MHDRPIARVFVRSVAWTGSARWFAQALSWASTLVVARLLGPEDYGLVAMATVFTGFMIVISELGIGVTVVTLRDLSAQQVAQLNALSVLTGTGACAIAMVLAPIVGAVYARPAVTPIVGALAGTLALAAVRTVPAAVLQKELRFKVLAAIEAAQAIAGAAIAVAAAVAGWRHWALVASIAGSALVWTALVAAVRRVPFARPRRRSLERALTFTRHQMTGTVAWYCYANADFAVAGLLLGAHSLGVYAMAWTLARIVPERFAAVITKLTPAFFAILRDDRAQLRAWVYRLTETVTVFTFPALIGLAVIADDAVRLAAGPQWAGVVWPMRLLALYGAFDVAMQLVTRALVADGDARFVSKVGIALLLVLPPAFAAAALWGPAGIALVWVSVAPIVRVSLLARARRRLGLELGSYGRALVPAVTGSIGLALAARLAGAGAADWPPIAKVAMEVACGGAAYVAVLWCSHRERVMSWRQEWFAPEMAA